MGCFFAPNVFENAPGYAFENGVHSVRGREIPIFTVFRGFRKGSSYRNRPLKYATSSRGNMLNMRHLPRKNPDFDTSTYTLGSDKFEVCSCPWRADMPRTAGRMGFSGSRSRNFYGNAQNQGPGKMAKYICVGAPLLILCVFVARLAFARNGVFKIDQFSLKPLKTYCETVAVRKPIFAR